MSLVRDWRRQVTRAAGISLVSPLALLLAGALVAAGGGLGGLGSLGQIATGPPLPDTGLGQAPRVSLGAPATGGAGTALATDPIGAAAAAVGGPTAGPAPAPGPAGSEPAPDGPVTRVAPPSPRAPGPGAGPAPGGSPGAPAPTSPPGGGGTTPSPAPVPVPEQVPVPEPVPDVLEEPREVIEELPPPVGPLSNDVLDTLTGPTP